MKKSGLILAAALAIVTAGCGSSESKTIDAASLADSLVTEIAYDDTLESFDEDTAAMYFDIEDGVEVELYMGSGSTAEEVAVFTAPDEETAKAQLDNVQEFLDSQAESFQDYIPEETKRVEDAVLEQKGNYVILCVSSDSDKAQEIIEEAFK